MVSSLRTSSSTTFSRSAIFSMLAFLPSIPLLWLSWLSSKRILSFASSRLPLAVATTGTFVVRSNLCANTRPMPREAGVMRAHGCILDQFHPFESCMVARARSLETIYGKDRKTLVWYCECSVPYIDLVWRSWIVDRRSWRLALRLRLARALLNHHLVRRTTAWYFIRAMHTIGRL